MLRVHVAGARFGDISLQASFTLAETLITEFFAKN